ncbi:cellulose biosynthesis cyclic di-GMP-binding regulatory protein BcsB [Companilactobacillus mindensis]|nr:cellulose biosynthesis cyclic di-GMP-binding regulatory protein BcsB [Companilactobacillus mindensis]
MNKSFINKRNGIKPNAINKIISFFMAFFIAIVCLSTQVNTVKAADDNQTYTQQFQNTTTTLSGKSVTSSMYFTKMGYWDLKKVTFNFNYQISQLASRQTSDITVSVNGVKFYSFRPKDETGFQTEKITVPLDLVQGSNKLQISGQVLDQDDQNNNYQLAQTPANWLTMGKGSNINFEYSLDEADNTLSSFYDHFTGKDTISYQRSKIATVNNPTADELTASMIALSGQSRVISTDNDQIPVVKYNQVKAAEGSYTMVISKYDKLNSDLKKQIDADKMGNRAVIKTYYANNRHYLTKSADRLEGAGHREADYFVQMPSDKTNADGSRINLHFSYSKNLNFNRSLVTLYVNNTVVGSKKLTAANANSDYVSLKVPKGVALDSSFTVRVAFDLEMKDQATSDNSNTPWAQVEPQSKMIVKSQKSNDLLFTNYPTLFINNETYDHLAVITPKKLNNNDFKTLTNIFNLVGNFSKSNTGNIQFYNKIPSKSVLKNDNVIVVGTPKNNPMVKELNDQLYFKYSKNFTRLVSNEKLSIEDDYGKNIGTAQLLRSPYNDKKGMLVVTGVNTNDTYLASTQINFQKNIQH